MINIVLFYEVYCDVEPKRLALQAANAELAGAQEKLAQIQVNDWLLNLLNSWFIFAHMQKRMLPDVLMSKLLDAMKLNCKAIELVHEFMNQ